MQTPDWEKGQGLLPAIIQDSETGQVLMLGFMSEESWSETLRLGNVTFQSRSKGRLWTKGESSGNTLKLISWELDCDQDSFLILAKPNGPTCHEGTTSCFKDKSAFAVTSLSALEKTIIQRMTDLPEGSYVTKLAKQGIDRMAQKVGEEAVETALASQRESLSDFENEASDLLFHLLVLLRAKGSSLSAITKVLEKRSLKKNEG